MNARRILLLGVTAWVLGNTPAHAHFLFIRIGPMAEAGRTAEVYFSEQAEAGDPRLIDKIAHTKLWVQDQPGEFRTLQVSKGADRLRANLPPSGSVVVVGVCEYGVLARPKQVPFLLRYYPKAMAGRPTELNLMQPRNELPLEIVATLEADRIQLVALRDGKPEPAAVFHTVDSDLANEEVKAGPDGRATWTPPSPGRYSVYVQQNTKASGEVGGKRYEEIREFATLAFEWPLERTGPDAEAVLLFEDALATRAQWQVFPGFSASITGDLDGRAFSGKVTIDAEGDVQLESDDDASKSWLAGQLESIAMHRRAESHEGPKPVLRFAFEAEEHPLGRLLLFEGGRFASSYRIKDRQITVVNRHVGKTNMTITTLDNERSERAS